MKNLRDAQLIMLDILNEVDRICKKNNIEYFLISGTLLGAHRHKGFIPWDDDLDIAMTRENYNKFVSIVNNEIKSEYFVQTDKTDKFYDKYQIPLKIRHMKSKIISPYEINKNFNKGIFIDIFPMDILDSRKRGIKMYNSYKKIYSFICLEPIPIYNVRNIFKYFINILFNKVDKIKLREKIVYKITKNLNEEDKSYVCFGVETPWNVMYEYSDVFPLKQIEFEGYNYYAPNNICKILQKSFGDTYMSLPKEEDRHWHALAIEIDE